MTTEVISSAWPLHFSIVYAMAGIVNTLDGAISHLADLADNPKIDYQQIVIYSSFVTTAFEVWLR